MELTNKNDYRYLQALDDIKAIGAETPPMLHEDTPRSLGIVDAFPATASTKQWVVWNGSTDGGKVVGDIYMWDGTTWEHKLPTDATAQAMYMQSLSECLEVASNETGRFNVVLTKALIAQQAVIDSLVANQAFISGLMANNLTVGNVIKSSNFNGTIDSSGHITDAGSAGFAQTKAGEQVMNNVTMRGVVNAKGLSIKGILPGDNVLTSIAANMSGGVGLYSSIKYKVVGTGTYRLKFSMLDNSITGFGDTTYTFKVNSTQIFTETHPKGPTIYTRTVDQALSFGDILHVKITNGGGRVSGASFSCDICTDSDNEFLSLVSYPEQDTE